MPRYITNNAWLWGSLAYILALQLGHIVAGRDAARLVSDSLVIGGCTMVSVSWFRIAMQDIRDGFRDGSSNISVSIWLIFTIILGYFLYVVTYTSLGRPEWLRESTIGTFFASLIFLSSIYAGLAPVNTHQELPRPVVVSVIIASVAGGIVTGVLITLAWLRLVTFGSS